MKNQRNYLKVSNTHCMFKISYDKAVVFSVQHYCSLIALGTYARQALLGLEVIHAKGIIHGDIKPENLMLDEHNRIKIIDFGATLTGFFSHMYFKLVFKCYSLIKTEAFLLKPESDNIVSVSEVIVNQSVQPALIGYNTINMEKLQERKPLRNLKTANFQRTVRKKCLSVLDLTYYLTKLYIYQLQKQAFEAKQYKYFNYSHNKILF